MIFQCHPDLARISPAFGPQYQLFCLDPVANPALLTNCPELKSPETRFALSEYSAMLYSWRNPGGNSDDWIGFTSYRQMDKVQFVWQDHYRTYLDDYDIVTWGWLDVGHIGTQAESCHPGIVEAATRVLQRCKPQVCGDWLTASHGVFANYWALTRPDFELYMEWSFPLVDWMLANPEGMPFLAKYLSHANGVGYLMERLFIAWYTALKAYLTWFPARSFSEVPERSRPNTSSSMTLLARTIPLKLSKGDSIESINFLRNLHACFSRSRSSPTQNR